MTTRSFAVALLSTLLFAACKHEAKKIENVTTDDNYPPAISKIITTKCATAGCHNVASYQTSGGGLQLNTWEHMFEGGNTGAAIVPYSPENSPLLYFVNAHEDLGPIPPDNMKMPLNNPPLSREEYLTLRNWIIEGAPDKNGNIPFASNADTRQKIYLAHQGCDFVSVIDAEKNVLMRCIPVGTITPIESAYSIKVAADGNAYLNFWGNEVVQKIDTKTDKLIDSIQTGYPNSNVLFVSKNGSDILLSNLFMNSLLRINTVTKQVVNTYGSNISLPHGIAANQGFDTFYVTEQNGNTVQKISSTGIVKKISIDGKPLSTSPSGPNPYQIIMSADFSKYFISCQNSNEVRVMNARTDTLISVISVGITPQEMSVSKTKPYLFVSCMNDPSIISLFKGSVYIINYNTLEVVTKISDRFYMPHALAIDDVFGKLFVFSRNIDPDGPIPHHSSSLCDGRNGYYSVYDFNKLQPVNNKRYEVTVDPFAADVRFK